MTYRIPKRAAEFLRMKFHIFPTPRGKKAFFGGLEWGTAATSSPSTIEQWATNGYAGCSWGIATGPSGLCVLDVDGDSGEASLLLVDDLPPTREVRTPSGKHLYYRGRCKSTVSICWPESHLDVRSVGGMVFAPGHKTESGVYAWANDLPIANAPQWLIDAAGEPNERKDRDREVLSEDLPGDIVRAKVYLTNAAPAIEGAGGDTATYAIACQVRDFGISEVKCLSLMMDYWNNRCEPPWDQDELWRKIQNAYNYAQSPQGALSVNDDFDVDVVDVDGEDEDIPYTVRLVRALNTEFAAVQDGPNFFVYRESTDPTTGHRLWRPMTADTFQRMLTTKIEVGGKGKALSKHWLESASRRTADWLVFDPALPVGYHERDVKSSGYGRAEGVLNLWSGWAVEPKRGDWGLIRDGLIRDLICSGDEASYDYVMGWLARFVQEPQHPAETALVLRGLKGVGKSTLGYLLYWLAGRHGMIVTNSSGLVGQFTGHLANKILLFADEAYWAGDKKGEGQLKALVTGKDIPIRAMRKDSEMARNRLHILMASNNSWVVPASAEDERRFAVFDVPDSRKGDVAFWKDLYDLAEREGGLGAMLYDLLHMDNRGYHYAKIPNTLALSDQKVQSLGLEGEWWVDLLEIGKLPEHIIVGDNNNWDGGAIEVDMHMLHLDYSEFAQGYSRKLLTVRGLMASFLSKMGCSRCRTNGVRAWRLPSLQTLRGRWESVVGSVADWPEKGD